MKNRYLNMRTTQRTMEMLRYLSDRTNSSYTQIVENAIVEVYRKFVVNAMFDNSIFPENFSEKTKKTIDM